MSRPRKVPPIAVSVVWGSRLLTLAEKVIWYQDWLLDQDGADGSYISHVSMAARLGDSIAEGTVSRIRQRLKRLTLHEPIRRVDARNLGWVSTVPVHVIPRSGRDVPAMSAALDAYLETLTQWSSQSGRECPDSLDASAHPEQTPESEVGAAALGGRGDTLSSAPVRQPQFSPAVNKKRIGAPAPEKPAEETGRKLDVDRLRREAETQTRERLRLKEGRASA